MDRGYFKMWRMWFDDDSPIWPNEHLVTLMVWISKKVTHKRRSVLFKTGTGSINVTLEPGQMIFGRHKAAIQLNAKPTTIWKRIKKLEKLGFCVVKSDKQYSIITLCNYSELNKDDVLIVTAKVTSKGQASDTKDSLDSLDKGHSNGSILQIPLIKRDGVFSVCQEDVDRWKDTFPGVDILPALKRIRQWNYDNPEKRKTKGGIRKHISWWLGNDQDKATRINNNSGRPGFTT